MESPTNNPKNEIVKSDIYDYTRSEINIAKGLYATNKLYNTLPIEKVGQYIDLLKDCYEVLNDDVNRIYGDIDYKDVELSEDDFNKQNILYKNSLIDAIKVILKTLGRNENRFCLYTSTSYEYKKISWRFILTDIITTKDLNKRFVKGFDSLYADCQNRYTIKKILETDKSVYSKGQKMRMIGTSKPNENRPLKLVIGTIEDSIISYIPEDYTFLNAEEDETKQEKEIEETPLNKSQSTNLNELSDLLKLLPKKHLETLNQTENSYGVIKITTAILNSYQMTSELQTILMDNIPREKYKRDDTNWLREFIRRYTPVDKTKPHLTIATIYYLIEDKNALQILRDKYKRKYFREIVGYTLPNDWNLLDNWSNEEGYLKNIPNDLKSVLVESHLGTGKTTQIKHIIKNNPNKSFLIISPRITFSMSMYGDYGKDNGFKLYSDIKGDLSEVNRLFIQLESIWRLENHKPYDYIILDEVESILKQSSPSTTHKHYSTSMKTFEELISNAKNVIALDAFITNRSIDLFNYLRSNPCLIRNNFNPYKRTAIEVPIEQLFSKNLQILKDKENPKRTITISSSLKKLQQFEDILNKEEIKYLSYHSDDDKKARKTTLEDVNKSWASSKIKSILYTSSISVGINYDNKKAPFNQIFIYASAGGSIPRDLFQGSLRARTLTDDLLTFSIDLRTPLPIGRNIEEIKLMIEDKNKAMIEYLKGYDITEYNKLSDWNKSVILRNKAEDNISKIEYREVFYYYLNKCGYSVSCEDYGLEQLDSIDRERIPYFDIEIISDIQREQLERRIVEGDTINEMEKQSLNKYYFLKKIGDYKYLLADSIFCREEDMIRTELLFFSFWNNKHNGRDKLINLLEELRFQDTKEYALKSLNRYDSYLELISDKPLKIKAIKEIQQLFKKRFTCEEISAMLQDKNKFNNIKQLLNIFNISIDDKETNVYYIKKLSSVLNNWCGDKLENILETQKRQGTKRIKEYSVEYSKNMLRKWFEIPKPEIEIDESDTIDIEYTECLIVDE